MSVAKPALDPTGPIAIASDLLPWGLEVVAPEECGDPIAATPPTRRGLHAALSRPLYKRGGVWLGWPGRGVPQAVPRGAPFRVAPVTLEDLDTIGWHRGYSAHALWPILHSMPGHLDFDRAQWRAYDAVNARFAREAAQLHGEVEAIWLHGHHLLRAPWHLRRLRPQARILFFLHTPFPPREVFETLPHGEELLRSLAACDLVGFQTRSHARNFLDCMSTLEGVEALSEWMTVLSEDRETRVGAFSMGIDWDWYESAARSAAPEPLGPRDERILLSVDRLAPTAGIAERLRAFDLLLERHPRWRQRVSLLEVLAPWGDGDEASRGRKREVDEIIGRVNGRFGSEGWLPVRYMTKDLGHEELCGLYRRADVALATPLRDGMNLVAKEYVACQVDGEGILVLSQSAGASESMREAVIVNPFDAEGTADSLDAALAMPTEERRLRMAALRERECSMDADHWADAFLAAAAEPAGHALMAAGTGTELTG